MLAAFSRLTSSCWVMALLACSSPQARPDRSPGSDRHPAVNPLDDGDEADADGMKVEGTLGTLEDEAIQAGLDRAVVTINRCFQQQLATEPYLGGKLALQLRVARDGSIKKVRISESSLGSLSVERCALASVQDARFSSPRGGEAEFTYPLELRGRAVAQVWEPGMVKQEILDHIEQLLAAAGKGSPPLQAPAGLVITFYVDRRGKVLSAGMTAADAVRPEFAERFIENLKQLTFEAATGGYAKVTYTW